MFVFAVGFLAALCLFPPASRGREEARERPIPAPVLAPPRPKPVVGERLSFHGRWFGIPVGYGWIEVKELATIEGRTTYHIEAQGHSNEFLSTFYPVHDIIHSYLDAETLQPLRFEKVQREGQYRAEEVVTFDYKRMTATYRSLLNKSVKDIALPPRVQDIISVFYWLRTQPITPGRPLMLDVYSDEKIYTTESKPLKPLTLELLWRGTFPCLLVEPVASFKGVFVRRGRVWIYLSTDERRIPLFVKVATPWGPMTGLIDRASLADSSRR